VTAFLERQTVDEVLALLAETPDARYTRASGRITYARQ
jgi:hypothetical protein